MTLPDGLGFARPLLLGLLLLVPLVGGIMLIAMWQRRQALQRFAGKGSSLVTTSFSRKVLKLCLLMIAGAALIIALAGPQIGQVEREVRREGVDIVYAIDVSQSMAVRDVSPDRLRVARQFIESMAPEIAGSRAGVILFAGDGVLRYPTTFDLRVLPAVLDNSGRGFRPRSGSSLRAAIVTALEAFPREVIDNPARAKAIILLSDGEDLQPNLPPLDGLRARNIRIYTIGIGTPAGGPIPTYDSEGNFQAMLTGANGQNIISRLDEAQLRRLAEAGGGRYWTYTGVEGVPGELGVDLRAQYTAETETEIQLRPDDRFQIFLAIALIALLLDWLLSDRRGMPTPRSIRWGLR